MKTYEVNFDGLVGPTHNFAGLAYGNLASQKNAFKPSSPKVAAKQGLAKMRVLMNLGLKQALLPPHERPLIAKIRQLGFTGPTAKVLQDLYQNHPQLLAAFYSSSSMWSANSATISPSADTSDHRVHITPANLVTDFHRYQEIDHTAKILKQIFADPNYFVHHHYLPPTAIFADEGAANHHRICVSYQRPGIELFVFGGYGYPDYLHQYYSHPKVYPARQSHQASSAIARLHKLDPEKVIFCQQNPDIIDQGIFHNDVVMLGNRDVLIMHEQALINTQQELAQLQQQLDPIEPHFFIVPANQISIATAIETYFFNSQLVSLDDDAMALIAPIECKHNNQVCDYLEQHIINSNFITKIIYVDCSESMKNGGGPACLRLRCVLTEKELKASHQGVYLNEARYHQLSTWVDHHYRDSLELDDLRDPQLLIENQRALDELTQILKLGSIYSFQL